MDLFSRGQDRPPEALSVTRLLRRMKQTLESAIGEVRVEGEVSNLKKQPSGHWYFSLKDEGGQIQCAMFSATRRGGAAVLRDGAKVVALAEASIYESRGQLQLIVRQVEAAGLGDLQARFEALKRRLNEEGLFDPARKRPLPSFPQVIGLITSASGAALQDMLQVLSRRAPWIRAVLHPVRVQGKGAELEIARAIERMGRPEKHGLPRCDLLIVGRGGGSLEDLWCFNEEVVARAIADCPLPLVSAVGHEIDFTIADFVADLRAPTPSAAAELAVPDRAELMARVEALGQRLGRRTRDELRRQETRLEALRRGALRRDGGRLLREPVLRIDSLRSQLTGALARALDAKRAHLRQAAAEHRALHPARVIERRFDRIDTLRHRLRRLGTEAVSKPAERLRRLENLLRALGPESAFQRGFSITLRADGGLVRSVRDVKPGEGLITKLGDGEISSTRDA